MRECVYRVRVAAELRGVERGSVWCNVWFMRTSFLTAILFCIACRSGCTADGDADVCAKNLGSGAALCVYRLGVLEGTIRVRLSRRAIAHGDRWQDSRADFARWRNLVVGGC